MTVIVFGQYYTVFRTTVDSSALFVVVQQYCIKYIIVEVIGISYGNTKYNEC